MRLDWSACGLVVFLLAHHVRTKKILLPMHIARFEAAAGLQRRDFDHFSDFYPQPQVQLAYGLNDGEDKMDFANVTLHAADGLPLVLLERLDHLIEFVDCDRKNRQIALAFKSRDAFGRAIDAWEFVNNQDGEEHRFLLITNHDRCSTADDRQPHIVTDLQQDSAFLTIQLTFDDVGFSQVSDNYELSWGQYERRRASTQARNWPRDVPNDTADSPSGSIFPVGTNEIDPGDGSGTQPESVDQDFWAPLGKKIEDAWNTFTSSFQRLWKKPDELPDEKLPDSFGGGIIDGTQNGANDDDDWEWTNRGKPLLINAKTDDKKKVFRDVSGDLKVFCTKCILEGSVLATVAVAKRDSKITASTLTINLSNFKSKGQLSVQRDGTNHAEAVNDQLPGNMKVSDDLDIIGSAVPDYGISMGDWGDLGFTWAYQFGFGIGINGIVDLGVGWEAGIKGNALLTIDLLGDNHRLVGEELLHYSPLAFVIRKLSGQCDVNGHGQATISFGLQIKAVKLEARVFMPLPEYQIALKPSKGGTLCSSSNSVHFNLASIFLVKGGICEAKGIDTGVITERKWNIQLKYGAVYNLGGGDHTVGDEPITPNFGGNPVALDCIAVPLGVFSEEGAKPLPGTTVPGKMPPPKPAAGKKEEDKQQTPCDGKNSDGETCPTSEVQTEDQVALSNDFPTTTLSSDGSIASLQSAAQPDFLKANDPNTPSLENTADSGQTNFLSANDNTASLQPGPLAASSTYNTASLQPGPLADVLSSADNTAPPVDQSASLASSFALPSSSLTDPTPLFQPQDSSHFLASANLDLTAGLV